MNLLIMASFESLDIVTSYLFMVTSFNVVDCHL